MLWDQESGQKCAVVTKAEPTEYGRNRALNRVDTQVRLDRVQELRLAIANGTYAVSVEQIADSLLRFAKMHSTLQSAMYP